MKGQRNQTQTFKSVAGSALVVPGLFMLFGNVACAVTACSQFLREAANEGLSVFSSVIVAASMDQHWFIHALLSLVWPILVVILGAVLLRESLGEDIGMVEPNQVFEGVPLSRGLVK